MSQDGPSRPAWTSADPGVTPAGLWHEWLDSVEMPPALDDVVGEVLVVSAHPDDEVLGAGGFLYDAVAQGIDVTVLCVSDGAASHPGSPTVTPEALAGIRRDELTTALSALGVNRTIHHELPDGGLDRHGDDLVEAISTAAAAHSLIVSVWRADRHPDHEAVGRAASAVASRLGLPLLEYPVWMWHWARLGDDAVPWDRARQHRLSPAAVEAKKRAAHAFVSQITDLSDDPADRAVLEPHVLDRLLGPTETFFAATRDEQERSVPDEDRRSQVDPEYFRAMYAGSDDPWGFSQRWYETRKYGITMSLLPAPRYERALELGSSIGILSALLAQRCGSLRCLELDPRAADLARARLGEVADRVAVQVADIADGIEPVGDRFDLVVASEVLYYLDGPQLTAITEALDRHRRAGATVIAAHWRHHVAAYPWTGDEVHRRLRTVLGPTQATYTDDDVVMDVFTPPGTDWVGKAGGLA